MKSTGWRIVGILLVIVAVLLIAAALVLPRLIDLNRYNGFLVAQLENLTGGKVALGPVTWGIARGVWLQADGLSVERATLFPGDVKLTRLYTRVLGLPLLSRRVVVDQLLLEGPSVTIRLQPTSEDEEDAKGEPEDVSPATSQGTAEPLLPVKLRIEKLEVREGRVRVEDSATWPGRPVVLDFTDLWIEGTHLTPGKEMVFQLSFRDTTKPGLGSLEGQVAFSGLTEAFTIEDPSLDAKATVSDLDVDVVDPYLKDESLSERLGGRVSLGVNYQGDFGRRFRVEGNVDLTELTYDDSSLWEKPVPGMSTRLSCELMFDPEAIRVQKLELNVGNAAVTLEGLLQDWKTAPMIRDAVLTSELPLAELIPLVPWKKLGDGSDAVRQSMAGGGKLIVERAAFPQQALAKFPDEWKSFLSGVHASIELSDLHSRISPLLPGLEHLNGHLRLEKGVLRAENVRARLGPLTLPPLHLSATDLLGAPKVSAASKGKMQLVASHDTQVDKLLAHYGLKTLSGSADFDMLLDYDHARPEDWTARVDLVMADVRAKANFADLSLSDLRGRVRMRREKGLVVTVEKVSGRMNESPVHLDGKLAGVGTRRTVLDAKVRTEGVDLSLARTLNPSIEELKLGGTLDLDMGVHYPHSDPMATRLTGTVKIRNLALRSDAPTIQVKDGDVDIECSGTTVNLKRMTLMANEQVLSLAGRVTGIREPRVRLRAASPNLNMDLLLASLLASESSPGSPAKLDERPQESAASGEEGDKSELPSLLRRLTAQMEVEVARGEYRGQGFSDLTLQAAYERGMLKSHVFNVDIGGGHVATKGSADFRSLDHVPFSLEPEVQAVPLELIGVLVGLEEVAARGPLTMKAAVWGRTGGGKDLLRSLAGTLEAEVGPGSILDMGIGGKALFRTLDLIDVSDIVSRKSVVDLGKEGMPYDSLHATTSFEDGHVHVSALNLESPSLDMEYSGTLDLVNLQMDGSARLTVFGAVDKGLGYVPLVGDAAARMTEFYMDIKGPFENPSIVPKPGEKTKEAAEELIKAPGETGKKVIKGVGKGLDKVF